MTAAFEFFSMFKSIDDAISSYLVSTNEPISLNSLAYICGAANVCEHNALEDARCLMNCIACVRQEKVDQFLVDEYKSYNKSVISINEAEEPPQRQSLSHRQKMEILKNNSSG